MILEWISHGLRRDCEESYMSLIWIRNEAEMEQSWRRNESEAHTWSKMDRNEAQMPSSETSYWLKVTVIIRQQKICAKSYIWQSIWWIWPIISEANSCLLRRLSWLDSSVILLHTVWLPNTSCYCCYCCCCCCCCCLWSEWSLQLGSF